MRLGTVSSNTCLRTFDGVRHERNTRVGVFGDSGLHVPVYQTTRSRPGLNCALQSKSVQGIGTHCQPAERYFSYAAENVKHQLEQSCVSCISSLLFATPMAETSMYMRMSSSWLAVNASVDCLNFSNHSTSPVKHQTPLMTTKVSMITRLRQYRKKEVWKSSFVMSR